MARENDLPSLLSKIHSKYKTPYLAIWISGALMIVAAVFSDLNQVIAISNFASLLYYSIANVAALRLSGKIRRYPSLVPAVGLLSCLSLLVFLKLDGWLVGVIGIGLGTVYYRTFHRH
jgi:APA family basic amino acid/polyamine antiporter